jgi:hypothetical protein
MWQVLKPIVRMMFDFHGWFAPSALSRKLRGALTSAQFYVGFQTLGARTDCECEQEQTGIMVLQMRAIRSLKSDSDYTFMLPQAED